jgi:ABC-type multidrug transport system fused ATPase/permease subunit
MGRDHISLADLDWVLHTLDLTDPISRLPDGLSSIMLPGGRSYADSFIAKITLARSMISRPKILMVNYLLHTSTDIERLRLIKELTKESAPWSLLILSNDSMIMQHCDRVMMMDAGKIVCEGKYSEIKNHAAFMAEFAVTG